MRHIEAQSQRAFLQWARLHPEAQAIFAIPNGGKRDAREGKMLKAEGVMAGIPDLMLPLARGGAHALFIEMKAPGGRMSVAQKSVTAQLAAEGYAVVVAHDAWSAISATKEYLECELKPGLYTVKEAPPTRASLTLGA